MRKKFALALYEIMREDEDIMLITGDVGYGMLDRIRDDFPTQFINAGAAEQCMMDMAVGIHYSGKLPIVYSITPFLLYRPFETIRNYIDHENVPVIMVGSGRDKDYRDEGFSHDASDHDIIRNFKNIQFITPEGDFDLREIIYSGKPTYLNLKRIVN